MTIDEKFNAISKWLIDVYLVIQRIVDNIVILKNNQYTDDEIEKLNNYGRIDIELLLTGLAVVMIFACFIIGITNWVVCD